MFMTGLAIFTGAALLLAKLRRRWMLKALDHDLALDVAVSATTLFIHWGSFAGIMAATIAGLMTSVATSTAKRWFGFVKGNTYYPGYIKLENI